LYGAIGAGVDENGKTNSDKKKEKKGFIHTFQKGRDHNFTFHNYTVYMAPTTQEELYSHTGIPWQLTTLL